MNIHIYARHAIHSQEHVTWVDTMCFKGSTLTREFRRTRELLLSNRFDDDVLLRDILQEIQAHKVFQHRDLFHRLLLRTPIGALSQRVAIHTLEHACSRTKARQWWTRK